MITVCDSRAAFNQSLTRFIRRGMKNKMTLVGYSRRIEGMLDYDARPVGPAYILLVVDRALDGAQRDELTRIVIDAMKWNHLVSQFSTKFMLATYDGGIKPIRGRWGRKTVFDVFQKKGLQAVPRDHMDDVLSLKEMNHVLHLGAPMILCMTSSERLNQIQEGGTVVDNKRVAFVVKGDPSKIQKTVATPFLTIMDIQYDLPEKKKKPEITQEQLELAYELASAWHKTQVDKAGRPYFNHVKTVSDSVLPLGRDYAVVGVLHDILEDTDIDKDYLIKNFGEDIVASISRLTHDKSVDYLTYVRQLKASGDQRAIAVKKADLRNNMDLTRLGDKVTEKDMERVEKYKKAYAILDGETVEGK